MPEPVYLGNDYTSQQTEYAEEHTQQAAPTRTIWESVKDTALSIDAGVNSAVNNGVFGVTATARNSANFGTALVHTPRRVIGSVMEGESPVKAFTDAISYDYLPSSAELKNVIDTFTGLVPTDEYAERMEPYYSDKFRFQNNQLNEITSTDSELNNLAATLG